MVIPSSYPSLLVPSSVLPVRVFALPELLPAQVRLVLDTQANNVLLLRLENADLAVSHRSFQLTPSAMRVFLSLLQAYPAFCSHRSLFQVLYPLLPEQEIDRNLAIRPIRQAIRPIRRALTSLVPALNHFGLQVVSLRTQGYVLASATASIDLVRAAARRK